MASQTLAAALGPGGCDSLIRWLSDKEQNDLDGDEFSCSRSEFVNYFLCYLRIQTESMLQTNANVLQILQHQSTPEKLFSQKKSQTLDSSNILNVKPNRRQSESPSRDKKKGRRVKTKLFESENFNDRILSSTPLKNSFVSNVTPVTSLESHSKRDSESIKERCDTPRMRHSGRSSSEKGNNLGDYITNATKVSSKKKKSGRNVSNESTIEANSSVSLDLSNSEMFPEIGAKKRIKPTNIDNSANNFASFNSDFEPKPLTFQENSAFKQEKFQPNELSQSFNTERSILKQERHTLMEKFNVLNTSSIVKVPLTPQIKVFKCDSVEKIQSYIEAESDKITLKEKLDSISEIYTILINNNFILSISAEIYFMMSIILSKQYADDYKQVENELQPNLTDTLLKSIHNCTYVAVKTLWNQRSTLEIMLDKHSLKLLGENKRVRDFSADLAKHLLNLYSLRCEQDILPKDDSSVIVLESRFTNGGVVCFNSETDSIDNFPSMLSFQNFKKQRDMFYEILRWWSESTNQSLGTTRTMLRSRVKSLLSLAIAPTNHAHLARLLVTHLLTDCTTNTQESKLSKLQRRLTGPPPTPAFESNRLPKFTGREEFYRDFLLSTESESFHAHVKDALASELCSIDAASLLGCEERQESSSIEHKQDYLSALKRLRTLAKFLGLLVAAPYQNHSDGYKMAAKHAPPKEKVAKTELLLRNYNHPPIDVRNMLESSFARSRLIITIPWLILYLAMMDYTCLRIHYYDRLLQTIFAIYSKHLTENMRKTTAIFLKLCLSWLFEQPHFPYEFFYENSDFLQIILKKNANENTVDSLDIIDENVLNEVCPYLKEFNILLLTSQPANERENSSFRHITPVSMMLNQEDRAKNKDRELQARLEQEYLRSLAPSTRRVLELVTERVTSAIVKELSGTVLSSTRNKCKETALNIVRNHRGDTPSLQKALEKMYAAQIADMRTSAIDNASSSIANRSMNALGALLPNGGATPPLETLARRAVVSRVGKWLNDNWTSTAILCKDIAAEMNHLLLLGESFIKVTSAVPVISSPRTQLTLPQSQFEAVCVSAAEMIIDLKESICQLLEYSAKDVSADVLVSRAHVCCKKENAFITTTSRRTILQLSIEILVVLVSRNPQSVTEGLLKKFDALWNECCPNRPIYETLNDSTRDEDMIFNPRDFTDIERIPTPISSEDETDEKPTRIIIDTLNIVECNNVSVTTIEKATRDLKLDSSQSEMNSSVDSNMHQSHSRFDMIVTGNNENSEDLLDLFNRILCPRNIVILSRTKCNIEDVWTKMANLLVFLLKNNYLSEDSLTEQCLAIYRQEWSQDVLESLSRCMREVSQHRASGGKFTLFLDFLAEYCGDLQIDLSM